MNLHHVHVKRWYTLYITFYCSHWIYTTLNWSLGGCVVRATDRLSDFSVPFSTSSRQPEIPPNETWLRLTSISSASGNEAHSVIAMGAWAAWVWYACPRVITHLPLAPSRRFLDVVNVISRSGGYDEGEEDSYNKFHGSGFVLLFWSFNTQKSALILGLSWPRGVSLTC